MRRLVLLDGALRDLTTIGRYIARQTGHASIGRSVTQSLRNKCVRLAALPGTLGRPRPELSTDLRSVPHERFIIFFRYRDDVFEVVRIAGASQDLRRLFEPSDEDPAP